MSNPTPLPGEGPMTDEGSHMLGVELDDIEQGLADLRVVEHGVTGEKGRYGVTNLGWLLRMTNDFERVVRHARHLRAQQQKRVDVMREVSAEVDRLRSECAALSAKVAELEGSARLVQARAAGWDEGYEAGCESDPDSLLPGNNPYRDASGMPHTPAQEAAPWIPSFNGDECPHRPEWSCPDHGECRACECDCNTYNADLEEPDLTLIPADLIVSDPEVCSGRPTMRGTRLLASMIAGHLAAGTTWEELAEWYPQMPIPPAETAADGLPDAERGTGVREPHTRPQGDGGSDA